MNTRCKACKCKKSAPKMKPYGIKMGTRFWCRVCDGDLVTPVNKKKTRQQVKKMIRSERV